MAGIESSSPDQIAGALHFALMLQELGAPCTWSLPGPLAELAWSLGVAGVEIPLGRRGGFALPSAVRQVRRRPAAARFELPSLLTSLDIDTARALLSHDAVPEADCPCPTCVAATTSEERVAHADSHNLWTWLMRRDALRALDAAGRVERYETRLRDATTPLRDAGTLLPRLRWLRRDAKLLAETGGDHARPRHARDARPATPGRLGAEAGPHDVGERAAVRERD